LEGLDISFRKSKNIWLKEGRNNNYCVCSCIEYTPETRRHV